LKFGKNKKKIDISTKEDLSKNELNSKAIEEEELFLKDLFDDEAKPEREKTASETRRHIPVEYASADKKATATEAEDVLGDFLSSDEIEAFFSSRTEDRELIPEEIGHSEASELEDLIIPSFDFDNDDAPAESDLAGAVIEADAKFEAETKAKAEAEAKAKAEAEAKAKAEAETKAKAEAEAKAKAEAEAKAKAEAEAKAKAEAEAKAKAEAEVKAKAEAEAKAKAEAEAKAKAEAEAKAKAEAEAKVEAKAKAEAEAKEKEEDNDEAEESEESSEDSDGSDEAEYKPMSLDESLDSFSYEDTCSEKPQRSKKFDVIRLGVLAVCVSVFAYCIWYLADNIREKYRSDLIYDKINEGLEFNVPGIADDSDRIVSLLAPLTPGVQTPTMDDIIKNGAVDIVPEGSHAAELARVRASLEHLKNINDDLYGYIMVPGTNISYPIAQHESDNDYYLDRAYNGEHLVNGSIFADVDCNRDVMQNFNTVLYGHNVTSGSMFNHVNMFFEKEFFDNTEIYLYTFDGIFVYKPFSIREADYDSGYTANSFAEVKHFTDFAESLRDQSDIKSDATFTAESRIITLSTCTNGLHNRRYVLHAYLVEAITD